MPTHHAGPPGSRLAPTLAVVSVSIAGLIVGTLGRPLHGRQAPQSQPGCPLVDRFFEQEVWSKVAERVCLRCHTAQGDARESHFVLSDPRDLRHRDPDWLAHNRSAFERIARETEEGRPRILEKVVGDLDHGGGVVLKPESTGYRILERYVRRVNGQGASPLPAETADDSRSRPFFEGVTMLSYPRLLRRVTLSLAGRLPSSDEHVAVAERGRDAIEPILDRLMQEDAFYIRLKEGFNDIFLTLGIEDNAETILSYDHFENSRLWTEKHDLDHVPEADRQRARWKLADVYRQALLREPLELIAYIIRNERPFTELAIADYILVSPYTARGYGIFDEVKSQFKNTDDAFEYIPAKLKALKNRAGETQESATGLYPHAGFLGMFHYLHRYPSTDTNRNRLRARMFYLHFLGIDIMQLAPRTTDASAVAAKYKVPTMEAADCVVCHKTIDPVAGIFQDFNNPGDLGPRKEGWYTDMFAPGFEGETMPASERWRAAQWLGERVVKDPRFAVAQVEHVYYLLMGRKVLQPPEDVEDPLFLARLRAYRAQRRMLEEVANRFAKSGFNLKAAFKALIATEFYRADGLSTSSEQPERWAELDDVGIVRLLTPEQIERKIAAIFGKPWGRLNDELRILYGGIDSQAITERNLDPSGAMGAIQRILANDVACLNVARDFRLEPAQRRLFPGIEPAVVPGDPASDAKIRQAIVALYDRLSGQEYPATHPEIDRTFHLFAGIVADAQARGNFEPSETYFCGGREEFRMDDPHYTIRAWRAVVSYLLRQHEFLYE